VRYQDDEGDWSEWSEEYLFCTDDTEPPSYSDNFDWADWAHLWNIGNGWYYQSQSGPGGWHEMGDIGLYKPSNPTGCPGAGYTINSQFVGNVAQVGRLLDVWHKKPAALVNTTVGANSGVNVAAKVCWFSGQAGFSWWLFNDVDATHAGVGALICGTAVPDKEYYNWDFINHVYNGSYTVSEDFQGVTAWLTCWGPYPYVDCLCCPAYDLITWANYYFMMCFHNAAATTGLEVRVWFGGRVVKKYTFNVPWWLAISQFYAYCTNECDEALIPYSWRCRQFPWYGVRLKVWHDYDADPTGKTHRIQASVTTPSVSTNVVAGGLIVADWGTGEAALPGTDGPWDIDETWVGGHDESGPGTGDGGLRCGWTGLVGGRNNMMPTAYLTGGTVFKDFVVTEIETDNCDTPCDAEYIPGDDEIPEPQPLNPAPAVSPCPPDQETADKELYLGGHASPGAIFQFGGYEVEAGRQITARITPNPVAPMGYGGECLFKRIVVVAEHFSDLRIAITPILNGERLDQYAQEEVFIGPGDRSALRIYEVPLYRAFEDAVVEGADVDRFKYGLRGAYFSFEMVIVDLCGIGLQLPGVWIDYEVVRESQGTGVVYTEQLLRTPVFVPTGQIFMGTKGKNRLLKAASGVTDDGLQVEASVFSNPVAPEGETGECEFRRLSLVVTRWNENPMDINVTPYINGEPLSPLTVNYKATTMPVTEITDLDLATYYRREGADAIERFRHRARGQWFHVKVQTGSGLQKWLTLEGADLEYDVVRESLQKDVR
jgi:hypothetical protein